MNLSLNFTLVELAVCRHEDLAEDNLARAGRLLMPLRALCTELLQPLRDHLGTPVVVVSGYRSPALNERVGGSKTSQHRKGEAADLHLPGQDLRAVWRWLGWESGLSFGQLILEGERAGHPTWIHLSLGPTWRPAERSGQVMTWSSAEGYVLVGRAQQ